VTPAPYALRPLLALAAFKVVLTTAFAGWYGWHRDELYYLASARHLALGYTDYPPLVPLLAAADQALFPGSLVALRLVAALAGAGVILMTGLMARDLGGGRRAQLLAGTAALLSPMLLGANVLFQTVSFDQLVWATLLAFVIRLLSSGGPRLWLGLGVVLGVGLETKYTVAGLALATTVGFLATRARRHFRTRWPWIGAAIAVLIFMPNLYWQTGHGWDSVRYTLFHRGQTDGPIAYWLQQLLLVGPLLLPVVVGGALWLYRHPTFRALAFTAMAVELLFFIAGGKAYYPAPIYPVLYAAGAVWLETALQRPAWVRSAVAANVALTVALLPIGLPVLPPDVMARSGLWKVRRDFADMYGWPDLAQQVALAYGQVPPDRRRSTVILAGNYGEAGALDIYGPALGLPAVVSPHLSYFYWAPPDLAPQTVVAVGFDRKTLLSLFTDVTQVGVVSNSYDVRNEEYGMPIYICSGPRVPLHSAWASLRRLD
jgi:4-amino-4-deoxy-L-arabinose transferase-like glycosyltransferase